MLPQHRHRGVLRADAEPRVGPLQPQDRGQLAATSEHGRGDRVQVRLTLAKFSSETEARAALERVKKGGDLAVEARRSLDATLAARGGDTEKTAN